MNFFFVFQVLIEEKLGDNAERQGERFRREIRGFGSPIIREVRELHDAIFDI